MPILDELPTPDAFTAILDRIIGEPSDGTGLLALGQLLNGLDSATLSVSVGSELNARTSASLSIDTSALSAPATNSLQATLDSINTDPKQLLAPVLTDLQGLNSLLQGDLLETLSGAFDGLNSIQSLAPNDSAALTGALVDGLNNILAEFADGGFAELRGWSDAVAVLGDEMQVVINGSGGSVQSRLIDYLTAKITALLADLLPQANGPAADFIEQWDNLFDSSRLSAINGLHADLLLRYNAVLNQFQAADFSDSLNLSAAETALNAWLAAMQGLLDDVDSLLNLPQLSANGLSAELNERFETISTAEVVDLSQLRKLFVDVLDNIRGHVNSIGLAEVNSTIEGFFNQVSTAIDSAQLQQLAEPIGDIETQINTQVAAIEGQLLSTVTTVRHSFESARTAIQSLLSNIGSFNGDQFEYHVQADIENFLNTISSTLTDTVQPILDTFHTTVGSAITDATTLLTGLQGEIDSVKNDLLALLQSANDALDAVDVAATLERMAAELDAMIAQLGDISFDPVVDVVTTELDDMADQLRQIDPSSLNEITIGALKVSVSVVDQLDFSVEITDLLMEQIDTLMALPKQTVDQLQHAVDTIQTQFSQLNPDLLLNELEDLLQPIQTALDELELDALLQPIEAWHQQLTEQLEALSLATLIQPLQDLYQQLDDSVQQLSPDLLLSEVAAGIDEAIDVVQTLSLDSLQAQAEGAVAQLNETLQRFAPATLLAPAVAPFATVETALTDFRPSQLLQPVLDLFDSLTAPLDAIDQANVDAVIDALQPLAQFPDALNPQLNFEDLHQHMQTAVNAVNGLGFAQSLAQLNSLHGSINGSFDAGAASVSVSASVELLNPLRNTGLSGLSARLQQTVLRLQQAFPDSATPPALVAAYDSIADRLQSLAPSWLSSTLTPDSLRAAILAANPLNIGSELDALYDDTVAQILALSPTQLIPPLQNLYDQLLATLNSIDPAALLASLNTALGNLTALLNSVDPGILIAELSNLFDELTVLVTALNPAPIIARLQTVMDDVIALLTTLSPDSLLSDLDAPLAAARALLAEFSVEEFKAPIRDIFDSIQAIIAQIDVSVLLAPIIDRLDDLRDELADGLDRTEQSFNGMLAAIPV